MKENIGKRYSWGDKSGTHRRQITGIAFQNEVCHYQTQDLDSGEEGTALADEIDKTFFPKSSGPVIAKGYKGKTITSKQLKNIYE